MGADPKKVVWFEGMTLDPHHFQQWDRYVRGLIQSRFGLLEPHGWGLARLSIDRERLSNGELVLTECTAIMPDGLVIDLQEADQLPDPRPVQEYFPSSEESVRVVLAVPAERRGGRNVQLDDGAENRETRFLAESVDVEDENTGSSSRPVEVARKNVQVRFETESLDGYTTLPLTEILRTTGRFALDDEFLPPAVHVNASRRLTDLIRQLLELLVAKSSELRERWDDVAAQRELTPSDITVLHLLGTVNRYIPQFRQLDSNPRVHPKDLFQSLSGLAAELSTSVEDAPVAAQDLPPYEHTAPKESFDRIEMALRQMLGEATPSSNYERVRLERQRESLFVGSVSREMLDNARFFLVVGSDDHSDEQLRNAFPEMARVASPGKIEGVLQSYTRALQIEPTRRIPTGMPVDHEATYFELEKEGSYWQSIREEESIAVFLTSDFRDVSVELIAVT